MHGCNAVVVAWSVVSAFQARLHTWLSLSGTMTLGNADSMASDVCPLAALKIKVTNLTSSPGPTPEQGGCFSSDTQGFLWLHSNWERTCCPLTWLQGHPRDKSSHPCFWRGKGCVCLPTQGHLWKNAPSYAPSTLIESGIGSFVNTPQSPELQGHQTQGPALPSWGSGAAWRGCGLASWLPWCL